MKCRECGFVFFDKRDRCPKCGTLITEMEDKVKIKIKDETTKNETSIPLFKRDETTEIEEETAGSYVTDESTAIKEEMKIERETRTKRIYRREDVEATVGMRVLGTFIDECVIAFIFVCAIWFPFYLSSGRMFPASFSVVSWWSGLLILIHLFYYPLLHSLSKSSIGKMVAGIKVVHSDVEHPSFYFFFVKTLLGIIFTFVCFINCIYAFFNADRLLLHDVLLGFRYVEAD